MKRLFLLIYLLSIDKYGLSFKSLVRKNYNCLRLASGGQNV